MAAIIGGLVTALFIFVGEHRLDDGSGDVTIREAPPPVGEVSENSAGVPVREVYTRSGPGVVSVDVASSEAGPGGGSGFVLDEQGHIVTNQHVVGGAEEISVRFASGVYGQNSPARKYDAIAPSGCAGSATSVPSGTGGSPSVEVRNTS